MRQRRSLLLSELLFHIVEVQNRDHEEPRLILLSANEKALSLRAHTHLTAHLVEMGLAAEH
jgi:hypothetical protein